jgi:hypothetical protein
MSNQTALEWVIQELRLRELEAEEIKRNETFLTETLERGLAMEQEQRHEAYHRGLQDCSEVEPSGAE